MRIRCILTAILLAWAAPAFGDERVEPIAEGEFQRLHALIKPQQGESPWREIAWLTNVTEARRKAAAEGKPMGADSGTFIDVMREQDIEKLRFKNNDKLQNPNVKKCPNPNFQTKYDPDWTFVICVSTFGNAS